MRVSSILRSAGLLLAGPWLAACHDRPTAPAGAEADLTPSFSVVQQAATAVNWHAQQAGMGKSGPVAGATANLVRNDNGISYRLSTNSLIPGNAYTLWLVVINNPGACAQFPCTAPEIFNPNTLSQVRFAAGSVAGGSGQGTFAGSIKEGVISGWNPDRMFGNSMGVEVHLVVNDHGPKLPEYMPNMIHSYRGGCSDASPFPAVFPATALADGVVGPNICRLYQAATFPPV